MTLANVKNYALAAALVESGRWSVDIKAGRIIGVNGKPLTRTKNGGYIQVKFRPEPRHKEISVLAHRVIYEHVNGPLPAHMTVNHINGITNDNRPENLEAVTQPENVAHAVKSGLYHANCVYCREHGKNHNYGKQ